MFIKDSIGQEYLEWEKGDVITITAGTGRGKSNFIKNELYEKAKEENERILFFIHRKNTKKQFNKEALAEGKDEVITYMTYQTYQTSVINGEAINIEAYKYIVCDEYHYFSNDSSFNIYTDVALEAILEQKDEFVLILMSATDGFIRSFLEDDLKIEMRNYVIPISFEFIKSTSYYVEISELYEALDSQLEKGSKTIVFIDSAKRCYELYERYKEHSMFVCSDGNKTYADKMDITKRDHLIKNSKFEDTFLFTTNTLDAGLNIIDDQLDSIVLDIADIDTLIQCVGRKRLTKHSDSVKLFIKKRINGMLSEDIKRITRKLIHVNYLQLNNEQTYSKKFYRNPDPAQIVYYHPNNEGLFELRVNELAYKHLLYRKRIIESIKELPNGYMQYMDELFGKDNSILHDRYLSTSASDLLSNHYENKTIIESKPNKDNFAMELNLKRGKNVAMTFTTINKELEKKLTSYRLVKIDSRKKGKGDKNAWIVKALVKQPDGSYKLM